MPILLALLLAACGGREPAEAADAPPVAVEPLEFGIDPELKGLRVRLSEAAARPAPVAPSAEEAEATPLTEEETLALLARAAPIAAGEEDRAPFALREGTLPPPKTGATTSAPFPPPPSAEAPPDVDEAALRVVRWAPAGEVPIAPSLSVTFSQPMVAVTGQTEAAAVTPARLEPQPPGAWRWVGTKTLVFDPEPRFPMATDYRVEIPAGVASARGASLAEGASFTFSTPPVGVVAALPGEGPQRVDPVLALAFDQRVDAAAITPFVKLRAGGAEVPLRPATEEEIAADEAVKRLAEATEAGRFLALRPVAPLSPATGYALSVEAGAPSAEGPRKTARAWTQDFRTYPPLRVEYHECAEGPRACAPNGSFWLTANNRLDEDGFDPSWVTVEPPIEDLRVTASWTTVTVQGRTKADTTYTVTVSPALKDAFGQELGRADVHRYRVGNDWPQLRGPGKEHVVLDPGAPPAFSVWSTNHASLRVRVYRVAPEGYAAFSRWMREYRYDGYRRGEPPGERVSDARVTVPGYAPDTLVETPVDLSPWLTAGHGQLVVWVEPTRRGDDSSEVIAWVQVTELGLTALYDGDALLAWATSLATGAPVPGVEVSLLGGAEKVVTDERGLARLEPYEGATGPHALVARRGEDVALLPEHSRWWNDSGGWRALEREDAARFFVFDDRGMYRPGEEVAVKGWLRRVRRGGELRMDGARALSWRLSDAQGVELAKGEAALSETGGFDLALPLPKTPNLGHARLALEAGDARHVHSFQIREFRRPEYEVATAIDEGPHHLGEKVRASVRASYFAGGALPSAPVDWRVSWSEGTFQPPNRSDFRFGAWAPWWSGGASFGGSTSGSERFASTTDAGGVHRLEIALLAMNPPRPTTVRAEATVTDVNRQRWSASESFLVHPASRYVGLKTDRGFYAEGDEIAAEAIVVDLDGEATPGIPVDLRLLRLDYAREEGRWVDVEEEVGACAPTSGAEAVSCALIAKVGGRYALAARIVDPEGRPNESRTTIWVSGGASQPTRSVTQEAVVLVPDRERYAPGDVAEVLVQAPFFPADALVTIRKDGILRTERLHLDGPSAVLRVPIGEEHVPNVHVAVDLAGSAVRTDDEGAPLPDAPRRVAFAVGAVDLKVPPATRTLTVEVMPREGAVVPGGGTVLDLRVSGPDGAPVDAEVAVLAVDEAVLALSGRATPDPFAVFYAAVGDGVSTTHLRSSVALADPTTATRFDSLGGLLTPEEPMLLEGATGAGMGTRGSGYGGGAGSREADTAATMPKARAQKNGGAQVAVREDFSAMALWAPAVRTPGGSAEVALALPDSLTRWRVLAVAVQGVDRFGAGEATVVARNPVALRPSPPRFLNFGDAAELPLVVQNQTAEPRTVEVALRVTNLAVGQPGGAARTAGRRVVIPPFDRREVRLPIAADLPGTARFQAVIASGPFADAVEGAFPVWTPATSEAFATYGELDAGAVVQPVEAPGEVWPGVGGLELTTSSTEVGALTDALLYLVQYPYDCSEQIGSRVLAVAALKDVLAAFEAASLPPPAELEAAVRADLERLGRRQEPNGGFAFWPGLHDEPYLTVHVANALVVAEEKGFAPPAGVRGRALGYLGRIEGHIPSWYSREAKWTIRAYALAVRHRAGDTDLAGARALMSEGGARLPLEAVAHLLAVTGDPTLLRRIEDAASESAGTASFASSYTDDADYVLLHASRRTDGAVLDALIQTRRDHDLIPKVARGLLDHRVAGRWSTTQENAFVLLALDRYFRTYEATEPDFVARAWIGDALAGEHAFRGRTTERARVEVPMGALVDPPGPRELTVAKEGPGRLYYRIGLRYAPKDLTLAAADHGFEVTRSYEGVDDPADVRREGETWHVRAGARVRVRVSMVAPARRTHVMLTDPLPAGLEALDPALKVSGVVEEAWRRTWFQHQNLRDERAEAYASLLPAGVYEYAYVAVATTPGRFVVPPPKAEEMYHPETFGRGATDAVVVE